MGTIDLYTPDEICILLGQRCRAQRLARNLTQADLAAMTGSSLSSIRRFESHGQATALLLVRVAQALHLVGQFESLFVAPVVSIADLERQAAGSARRRAAKPRRRDLP